MAAFAARSREQPQAAMTPMGSEQPSKPTRKTRVSKKGGAQSGALIAPTGNGGDALAQLAQSWDTLPPAVRAGIEAMVAASKPRG